MGHKQKQRAVIKEDYPNIVVWSVLSNIFFIYNFPVPLPTNLSPSNVKQTKKNFLNEIFGMKYEVSYEIKLKLVSEIL